MEVCWELTERSARPTFIQYLPTMYLLQRMWAYQPNYASMLGQRRSPLLLQCRSYVYDAGPTLIHHWVCCILFTNTWHSSNAVSMLSHSLRRWPDIETALGDCTVFPDSIVIWGTLSIPAPETPDNTIHWSNADVLQGHHLRRWANIIPTQTL